MNNSGKARADLDKLVADRAREGASGGQKKPQGMNDKIAEAENTIAKIQKILDPLLRAKEKLRQQASVI